MCGVAVLCLFLLPLGADWELFCAEGYTQVTGVMAMMMMTGRVLLLCALCVLWCGAVFGYAGDDCWGEGGGNVMRHANDGGSDAFCLRADCGLSFTRMGLMRAVEAGADDVKVDVEAASGTLGATSSGRAPGGTGGGDAPGGKEVGGAATPSPGPAVQKTVKQTGELNLLGLKDDKNTVDPAKITVQKPHGQTTNPQSPSTGDNKNSPGVGSASKINADNTPLSDEPLKEDVDRKGPPDSNGRREGDTVQTRTTEDLTKEGGASRPLTAAEGPTTLLITAAEKPPAPPPPLPEVGERLVAAPQINTQTEDLNASPRKEEFSLEVTVSIQEPQSFQEKKKPREDSREKENKLTKVNEQIGKLNFHGESTQTPPSASSDGVNNVAGGGTEEGSRKKTPQSEAAGKRGGKQAGNKNDAAREIPVEYTGGNATAVTGHGEGSPAAVTATTPDVRTESKPTTNDLKPPSTEGATQVSTTPDGNDASDSTEKAASQSVGYTTATKIATNSTNQTTTVESDSSTAVSHTTSPLLLLLVVACAAAAVVAA
ncbi:mucin-associated surface protein (MASP), putative [Trypanosoma cruzi marinkellei]|uniref:Mucin-associated surface protein (MASP), putative n=1 Tax=Trypanosoma cruzi marinkellei TaxID=85056 RepID=K2NBI5_TRYCR|nr:mucin-associated surface protein (MASP), putative [Trypanosoma cruzi marinkellei]